MEKVKKILTVIQTRNAFCNGAFAKILSIQKTKEGGAEIHEGLKVQKSQNLFIKYTGSAKRHLAGECHLGREKPAAEFPQCPGIN